MKWQILGLLFLIACAKVPETVTTAVAAEIVLECKAVKSIGEGCIENCDCLKPGKCISGICSLTNLEEGKPCFNGRQCMTSYCVSNVCGVPEELTTGYGCEYDCTDRYDGSPRCQTICRR